MHTLTELGGEVPLKAIYALVADHPKTKGKAFWQARLRNVLEKSPEFVRVGGGLWSLASFYTKEEVEEFNRLRREAHPLLGPRQKS